jgi:hypothetical protein
MKKAILVSLLLASVGVAHAEGVKRCGWIENDMPGGDLTLSDRDGRWGIVTAAGQANGLEKMPNTNKGDSCGCLSVNADARSKRITQIFGGKILPVSVCQKDKALK